MVGTGHVTPEEFYSQCLSNVTVLNAGARREAAGSRAVEAVTLAWGADVYAVQADLWERILVASPRPQRKFFRVAEAIFAQEDPSIATEARSAVDLIQSMRSMLVQRFSEHAQQELSGSWGEIGYLTGLPAPTIDQFASAADGRLSGLSATRFLQERRSQAADGLLEAQGLRVRGDLMSAIQRAYETDMLSTEAYLVESALASGDRYLTSVAIRWELVAAAIARMAALPNTFLGAQQAIREAIVGALTPADGARLASMLERASPLGSR